MREVVSGPLFYLCWLHVIAGEWDAAVERADESRNLSLDAGLGVSAAQASISLAVVDALRGQLPDARARLAEAERHADELGALCPYTRSLIAWVEGDAASAAAELGG